MSMSEIVYRDYGAQSGLQNLLTYDEEMIREPSQVFDATHDKAGIRLPYRNRSFISFSFGGKWIEDFNLIAVTDGNRMDKALMGEFEDLTSQYDVLDGQIYHSTHYRTLHLPFTLATDGMDQKQLEDFRHWFAGGKTRPLILAEHPNRQIMARVAQPPEMKMLPFEKEIEVHVGNFTYPTSTTVYKGEINIEFVADDPFWEGIVNIFGEIAQDGSYVTQWDGTDFFGNTDIAQEKLRDVIKIVYEDGVPIYNMIDSPMLFGDDIYASSGGRVISRIAKEITQQEYEAAILEESEGYYNNGLKDNNDDLIYFYNGQDQNDQPVYVQYYCGAVIEGSTPDYAHGVIDGAFISSTTNTVFKIEHDSAYYLYYAGTAPSPVVLEFTIPITLNQHGYINSIANSMVKQNNLTYNTITIEGVNKHEVRLTTSNFLTSYNNAMYIINNMTVGQDWESIRTLIRDQIRHPLIRKYAIMLINSCSIGAGSDKVTTEKKQGIAAYFKQLFRMDNGEATTSLSVVMDSKMGRTLGTFEYYDLQVDQNNNFVGELSKKTLVEDIGDMVSSNYLILDEKNYFNSEMNIVAWDDSEEGRTHSYKIYHSFPNALTNFSIHYKNKYY